MLVLKLVGKERLGQINDFNFDQGFGLFSKLNVLPKSTADNLEHGEISSYYIKGEGWISKKQGIMMAKKGLIDVVVATSRDGNLYLRAHPDHNADNNLSHLI